MEKLAKYRLRYSEYLLPNISIYSYVYYFLFWSFRQTAWDMPPKEYEDITPVQFKALRGRSDILSIWTGCWRMLVFLCIFKLLSHKKLSVASTLGVSK